MSVRGVEIEDGYLVFPGFLPGTWGVCHLRIVRGRKRSLCLVSEIRHNPGPSVTNAIQGIWRRIQEEDCIPKDALLVEHYSDEAVYEDGLLENRFAVVRTQGGHPFWKHITEDGLARMVGCSTPDLAVPLERLVLPVKVEPETTSGSWDRT